MKSLIQQALNNEKGVALLTTYVTAVSLVAITAAAYTFALSEVKYVNAEVSRLQTYAAAEAGVQTAIAQIGNNAFTGFINTNAVAINNFQSSGGANLGSVNADITNPNGADWVIINATANVDGQTRSLEARIFLDSNLSKYLVYSTSSNFSSGTNAQYGNHDGVSPLGVPANEDDRAAMYFTGDWTTSGSNVKMYGDVHMGDEMRGNGSANVYGDTYAARYRESVTGSVLDDGVSGGPTVNDGYDDDIDRNRDSTINSSDYPDRHDLTADGAKDSHKTETLVQIDHNFYSQNATVQAFAGSSPRTRYMEFVDNGNGTSTIREYSNAGFTNQTATHSLPNSALIYVNGDAYVKGEIAGRISVVSSDDIFLSDNISYAGGQTSASPQNSTAFLAKDKMYFLDRDLEVSGILYAENQSGSSRAMDSTYEYNANQNRLVSNSGAKSRLRLFGNRIMKGGTNLGNYDDRVYGYDKNLKYYRPPGIPVVPDLRTIRETNTAASGSGGSSS